MAGVKKYKPIKGGKPIPSPGGTSGMRGGGGGRKAVGVKNGKKKGPTDMKPLPIKGKKRGR